jgi:hypothetical protein
LNVEKFEFLENELGLFENSCICKNENDFIKIDKNNDFIGPIDDYDDDKMSVVSVGKLSQV